jgi:hypothetical protein
MLNMPLIEDRIQIGRCYGMTMIVAKVIQIYPLDIGLRKNPVKENVVRWAWRDAAGSESGRNRPGGYFRLLPLQRTPRLCVTASVFE